MPRGFLRRRRLVSNTDRFVGGTRMAHVRVGSWLSENAKTLNRDRTSYSSKTVLVAQRASGFNLEIELKNIILRRVSIFEFLHSQGQNRKSASTPLGVRFTLESRHDAFHQSEARWRRPLPRPRHGSNSSTVRCQLAISLASQSRRFGLT